MADLKRWAKKADRGSSFLCMNFHAIRILVCLCAVVSLSHLARSAEALPQNDPDAERSPPEDIVITMKGKGSTNLGSGYLWRMANRVHLAWAAQKPIEDTEEQWFSFEFVLYPDGSVSDIKFTGAKLDANGKKAVRAFLEVAPFEAWSETILKKLKEPTVLQIGIWLKAKQPNQALQPTAPSGRG